MKTKLTVLFILALICGCTDENGTDSSSNGTDSSSNEQMISASNSCETAVDVTATTQKSLRINTSGEVWINYTGLTDLVQFDTCNTDQSGTFEVYHNCDWYNDGMDTINGRGEQRVNNCYDGFYGDVYGIRGLSVKIRFVPDGIIHPEYVVNINEVGY